MASGYTYVDHLQVVKGFCDKADAKDKLTGLIQFACMFLSNGEPGQLRSIMASVGAARKVFRIMRPLEILTPLLAAPGFAGKDPLLIQLLNKIKTILMALFFAGDHFTWAYSVGLISDKAVNDRWAKISTYSWLLGSVATVVTESYGVAALAVVRKEGESEEDFNKRLDAARTAINQKLLVVVHATVQSVLAAGLSGVISLKPRTIGFLGMVVCGLNCYFLMPSYPKLAPKAKSA